MKFLVIDCGGIHVDTAKRLGAEGNETYYFCPYYATYPKFVDFAPGVGIKEFKKVLDYSPYIDKVDVIMFPDIGMGKFANWLREQGYTVFGAGKGEEMELDRFRSVETMKQLGIKCPKTYRAKGIDGALGLLRKLFNVQETNQAATGKYYAKLNIFRGSAETFPIASLEEAEFMFDALREGFGPFSQSVDICINESAEGVECGADLFFDGTKFVMPAMVGFENVGSYVGHVTDDLSIHEKDLARAAKYLSSVNYRGYFSFECIYDGTDCYWIDWTCRSPMPLGLMYPRFCKDWGKLVSDIAQGNAENTGLPFNQYLGCMEIHTEEALSRWLPLKGNEHTLFLRHMIADGRMYSVPGVSTVGVITGQGKSLEEVEQSLIENSDGVEVYYGRFQTDFLDGIKEKFLAPLAKMGVKFGTTKQKGGGAPEKQSEKADDLIPVKTKLYKRNDFDVFEKMETVENIVKSL